MNFSKEEVNYVRDSIRKSIRTDLRSLDESRELNVEALNNIQSDGSVKVSKGNSEVIISIQFKESEATLKHLYNNDFLDQTQNIAAYINTTESNLPIPECIEEIIISCLEKYKIGLRIDFNIVYDDGNLYELFYSGLRSLLSDLEIPDIDDLNRIIKTKNELPFSKTVCIFDKQIVVDPCKIEEVSCDHIIYMFYDNENIVSVQTVNNCDSLQNVCSFGLDINTFKKSYKVSYLVEILFIYFLNFLTIFFLLLGSLTMFLFISFSTFSCVSNLEVCFSGISKFISLVTRSSLPLIVEESSFFCLRLLIGLIIPSIMCLFSPSAFIISLFFLRDSLSSLKKEFKNRRSSFIFIDEFNNACVILMFSSTVCNNLL